MAEQAKHPGFGRFGILEEDEDGRVLCHICGEWRVHLGNHVYMAHGILAQEYKDRYGLRRTHGLASERSLQRYRDRANIGYMGDRLARDGAGLRHAQRTLAELQSNRAWKERTVTNQSESAVRQRAQNPRKVWIACAECGTPRLIKPSRVKTAQNQAGKITTCGSETCQKKRQATGKEHFRGNAAWTERSAHTLTWVLVDEIRERLARGEKVKEIAPRYGISPSMVYLIKNNRTWVRAKSNP